MLGAVVFGSATGLGYQTKAIYDHLKPAKTMLVDISSLNRMPVHAEWYDCHIRTKGIPTAAEIDQFLDGLDTVLLCETPLNYYLFERADALGVRTILQANPEFFDYFERPHLPRPSVVALPTPWLGDRVASAVPSTPVINLPVPIDRSQLPQRTITSARRFFHIAGRPAVMDRNGTLDFIRACRLARSLTRNGVEFVLYCQQPTPEIRRALQGTPVRLVGHVDNPADMYRDGDVLVLPRRYGGLCLPAQEALGCGIPILMPDIAPNNAWLPDNWLLRVDKRVEHFAGRTTVDVYRADANALANRMIYLARNDELVAGMHREALELAERKTWEALLPLYEEVLTPETVAA